MNGLKCVVMFMCICWGLAVNVAGQNVMRKETTIEPIEIAEELYTKGHYYEAIRYYNNALEEHYRLRDNYDILYHLAESYRHTRAYKKALSYYDQVYNNAATEFPLSGFWRAKMNMHLENYPKAQDQFKTFLQQKSAKIDISFTKRAKRYKKACKKAPDQLHTSPVDTAKPLNKGVNRRLSNYGATIRNDTIWFSGTVPITQKTQKLKLKKVNAKYDSFYVNRLFYSLYKKREEEWSQSKQAGLEPPDEASNLVAPVFNPLGNTMYFSLCQEKKGKEQCHIYKSKYTHWNFKKPVKLDKPVNQQESSSKHPFITRIGSARVLFFVSDREDSKGGYDIFYTIIKEDGSYGEVVNLGRDINTAYDEYAPFFDKNIQRLYFSSKGHEGFGGFDIYRAKGDPFKGWENVQNFGYHANTGADDYHYSHYLKNQNTLQAYIASNRQHDQTLDQSTCCDNLYTFSYPLKQPSPTFTLKYRLFNQDEDTLHYGEVEIFKQTRENVVARNTKDSNVLKTSLSKKNTYDARIYKPGYDTVKKTIQPPRNDTLLVDDIYLEKQVKPADTLAEKQMQDTLTETDEDTIPSPTTDQEPEPEKRKEERSLAQKDTATVEQTEEKKAAKETVEKDTQKVISTPAQKDPELPTIHYPFNIVRLTPKARRKIDKLAEQLKTTHPQVKLVVASHTDNIDTEKYNIRLSKRRTQTVLNYLISKGISSSRLIGQWYGEANPVAPNQKPDGSDNPKGRWKNRRTEFRIVKDLAHVQQGQMVSAKDSGAYEPRATEQSSGTGYDKETYERIINNYGDKTKQGLMFQIQIGAFKYPDKYEARRKQLYQPIRREFDVKIRREQHEGLTKFLVGQAYTLNKAIQLRKKFSKLIPNAFIIPYYKDERINMVDAIELLEE